ncbi:hypothetical protein PVAND_006050 [Polypedilum vanderplanki]|uniref:Fatty acyl-CoA reductase n=1 Tax=Polypedilum vanderplanki TaxID=319348 RepID=A0A9J6C1Y0_POLVA|nr:hypothetical protein PVAND_006050 [Polypedilum vanderplanki]
MAQRLNSVQEFYKDKTIFITGGSGFMGKVLIEKLLYSCSDLKQIIILMRVKRGKNEMARVKEFEALPLFKRIMDEKPEVMKKILVVSGEICEKNLGMSDAHFQYVIDNTNIIFHVAASVRFQAPLKSNIMTNLVATKEVLEIAKTVKNLTVMVHVSTAFCNVEFSKVNEIVYEAAGEPLELIKLAKEMDENAMANIEKKLLGLHPNTYTYTKRLAENLVRNEFENSNLPICILRPSIVGPTLSEPFAGWVDSLSAVNGISLASKKGILRCMLADLSVNYNFIPVDQAINGFIMAAKVFGTTKKISSEIPVYNVTTHEHAVVEYQKFFDVFNSLKFLYPLSVTFWWPNVTFTQNKYYYWFNVILFQWIPAYFIDMMLLLFGRKRIMVRVQKKIASALDAIKFFAMKNWDFNTDNFHNLTKIQSDEEYHMFNLDTKTINAEEYFENSIVGGRIYQDEDPLTTVPKATILIKFLYGLDLAVKSFFSYFMIRKLLMIIGLSSFT